MKLRLAVCAVLLCACVTPTPAEDPVAHDDDARAAQHDELEQSLAKAAGTRDEPQLLLQLAELEAQQSRLAARQADERATLAAEARQRDNPSVAEAQKSEAERLAAEAETLRSSAAGRFDSLASKFPKDPSVPLALVELAEVERARHRDAQADAALARVVRDYPAASEAADAHAAIGDRLFAQQKLEAAIAEYEAAAKSDRLRAYATYKRAWCALNLSRWQEATAGFFTVMLSGEQKLAHEAAKDWVRAWAMTPGSTAAGARAQLEKKVAPATLAAMLKRLSATYRELGREADAAAAEALAP